MKRLLEEKILDWYNQTPVNRLPLVINGARQVGKTYLIKQFVQNQGKKLVYLNFEEEPQLNSLFETTLDPQKLINSFATFMGFDINPNECIIVFDEIQNCHPALTSLKYFAENLSEYALIAAGSLLGVALNHQDYSFPVGKVEMLTLYPLSFFEFLEALGKTKEIAMIKEAFKKNQPIEEIFHQDLLREYYNYTLVGGLPAVVKSWTEKKELFKAQEIQRLIFDAYGKDMSKYSKANEAIKILATFNSMADQLKKPNQKFQYKIIDENAKARGYELAVEWLIEAGLVIKVKNTEMTQSPIDFFANEGVFKLFMFDVGLLTMLANLTPDELLPTNFQSSIFRGYVAENYVAQQLKNRGYQLNYWVSEGKAELDFIYKDYSGRIIPLEVKSGANNKSQSLSVFQERYKLPAVRVSSHNFGQTEGIRSIPLYAVDCL